MRGRARKGGKVGEGGEKGGEDGIKVGRLETVEREEKGGGNGECREGGESRKNGRVRRVEGVGRGLRMGRVEKVEWGEVYRFQSFLLNFEIYHV